MHACMLLQDETAIGVCQDRFLSWRVVGIPKRCEAAARPIAIASAVVRSWNRALLAQFPPPEGQYCGSRGHSAVSATLAWLRPPASAGPNSTSAKHLTASCVMLPFAPAPPPGLRGRFWTVCGAWFGVLPAVAFFMERPHRKLCALHVACLLVIPAALPYCPLCWGPGPNWLRPSPGLRTSSTWMIGVWLIMPPRLLNAALNATDHHVEHLGIKALHGRAELPELRVCFDQICSLASGVELLPGRMEVREQLLLGLVMPKLLWSAPLVPEIPNTVMSAFFKAMRGHVTWWCKGRVWADHITLHPQFAPVIRCLVTAAAHAGSMSVVLRASVAHHAQVLDVRVVCSQTLSASLPPRRPMLASLMLLLGRPPLLATLLTRASTLQPMKAMLCGWLPVFWHLPKCSDLGSILKGLSRWIWRFSQACGSAGVAVSHPLISPL